MLAAPLGSHVSFRAGDSSQAGLDLLDRLRETEPDAVRDRDAFVARMGSLYDTLFSQPGKAAASQGLDKTLDVVPALDQGLVHPPVRQ